ncbi:hypothetical protein JCM6882_006360 [Rhodosporidiobolus microsporus]
MPSSESASGSRAASPSSDAEGAGGRAAGRRKSTRAKKAIQRLDPSSNKKKRSTSDDDEDDAPSDADEDDDFSSAAGGSDDDEDEAYKAPKTTSSAKKGGSAKKPRASAGAGRGRGRGRGGARKAGGGRKKKDEDEEEDDFEGGEKKTAAASKASAKDFKIENDNGLFNAVKSPNTALAQTAEDWIEQYKEDSGPAMAELVNFVLRCCGCNATIDEHQAEDENGVVENLKDIVDEFKQESNHAYPLISKSKPYKKFRSSLAQFLSKLFHLAADDSLLFTSSFHEHFTSWVYTLSSSQIRALRHTATVVVLLCVDALSELHVAVKKEHGQAVRAKEAEEKKGRKDKGRLRDMERQVKEVHERLEQVEGFIDEGYTSVFVNRYRDADAVIRSECIAALGAWMKIDPDHWIDGDYLRYIGWVLSDESKEARRESVKALFSLYQKDTHIGKLHHFTDRFKQQLVDMAVGEHDLSVRIQAIHVARQIDGHGLLTEKQRDEVAQLVFEREKRVRGAAAEFWKGLVEEEIDNRKGELEALGKTAKGRKKGAARSKKEREQDRQREAFVGFKVLAELLVRYGKELDGDDVDGAQDDEDEDSQRRRDKAAAEDLALPNGSAGEDDPTKTVPRGRVAFAVEALWDGVEAVRDWEAMLDFLLKDHSEAVEGSPAAGGSGKKAAKAKGKKGAKGKGKKKAQDADGDEEMQDGEGESDEDEEEQEDAEDEVEVPEQLKLSEEEESLLLEVLVACLTRVVEAARGSTGTKKEREQDDEDFAALSRAVIDALPKLFAKHQTFTGRMVDVLSIPRLVNLDLYLDMRLVSAYESLWDDVTKQFLKHTSSAVLDQAALTLVHFISISNLSATNNTKLAELEEALIAALRTSTTGRDVESASFEDDEVLALTACVARIEKLAKVRNLSNALEDTDGGKETSAADLLDAVVNRGRLGYQEEASMIEHALNVLGTHIVWQLHAVTTETLQAGSADVAAVLTATEKRQSLLDKLEEFAVGNETNAAEGVKQVALAWLLDIHSISRQLTSTAYDKDSLLSELKLITSDELQARCAGYVEAEIERYAEQLADAAAEDDAQEDEDSGSETETEETVRSQKGKKGKKGKGKKAAPKKQDKRKRKSASQIRAENAKQQAQLVAQQRFEQTLAPFVRAIHCGALDLRHAVVLLKHWGRLGATFDEQAKLLMHDLRDEGNYGSGGDMVASVVVEALQGACDVFVDGPDSLTEEHLISLARHLVGVVVVRGAQLAVVDHLPIEDHLRIHLDGIKWIVKKLAHFEETKRRDERNKALAFFKALAHLLFGMDGRNALKVKTSLDSLLDEHNIEVSTTSKTWEPIRAYQRRLITAMSKDPSIQKAATSAKKATGKGKGKGKAKSKAAAEDDDEEEDQLDLDDEDEGDVNTPPPESSPAASRSRRGAPVISQELGVDSAPAASTASRSPRKRAAPESQDVEEAEEDVEDSAAAEADASSPRKKQRKEKTPDAEQDEQLEDLQEGDLGTTMSASASQSHMKKRVRAEAAEGPGADGEDDDVFAELTGDLGETQTQSASVEKDGEAQEEEREAFEREGSADSVASLTDIKKKKKRARR